MSRHFFVKRQFSIRTLGIVTFLVALSLPFAIKYYDDVYDYLFESDTEYVIDETVFADAADQVGLN